MNKKIINKLITAAVIASFGLTAVSAMAGPDFFQQQMTRQLHEAKQKLKAAEAAKGAERQKLMDEHMKMLHETMEQCRALKPKASMTAKEHEDWIHEHQKIMDQMMDQMMEAHHMMMNMGASETTRK